MAGLTPKPEPEVLWEKATFSIANDYIEQLGLKERKKVLGYIDGEEVLVTLVGHVETLIVRYEDDDLFYGLCEIGISGESIGHGYIWDTLI